MHFSTRKLLMAAMTIGALSAVAPLTPALGAENVKERKVIAIIDGTQSTWSDSRRCVVFYDVTDVSPNVNDEYDTFNPSGTQRDWMFAVWTGYEINAQSNFEDPETIAVNPVNGDVYLLAFDSGSEGVADSTGDTQGDLDLYRINYSAILAHWIANGSTKGVIYGPTTGPDGTSNPNHPDAGAATVHLAGAVEKIGEIARPQNGPFYDIDLEFVRPDRLVLLDNQIQSDSDVFDDPAYDHQLRLIVRRSTSNGAAVVTIGSGTTASVGGWNRQTVESWESGLAAKVNMDFDNMGVLVGRSEPVDISYTLKIADSATVEGVWIGEGDGGGDDVSFFEITNWGSFSAGNPINGTAAAKRDLNKGGTIDNAFGLDNNPRTNNDPDVGGAHSDNYGFFDWVIADNTAGSSSSARVLFGESGFNDQDPGDDSMPLTNGDPDDTGVDPHEPRSLGLTPVTYNNAGDIEIGTPPSNWTNFGLLTVPNMSVIPNIPDDDLEVTDGRFATFDTARKWVWQVDIDSGSVPDVTSDIYAIDLATGNTVYGELNCLNHFVERHGVRFFLRGDVNGDGQINATDRTILEGLSGGGVTIEDEWYDLTGDNVIDGADLAEFDLINS